MDGNRRVLAGCGRQNRFPPKNSTKGYRMRGDFFISFWLHEIGAVGTEQQTVRPVPERPVCVRYRDNGKRPIAFGPGLFICADSRCDSPQTATSELFNRRGVFSAAPKASPRGAESVTIPWGAGGGDSHFRTADLPGSGPDRPARLPAQCDHRFAGTGFVCLDIRTRLCEA